MGVPISARDFLGDQAIGRIVVRDTQQGLGEAHERDALLIRKSELLKESVEVRAFVGASTRPGDECAARGDRGIAPGVVKGFDKEPNVRRLVSRNR